MDKQLIRKWVDALRSGYFEPINPPNFKLHHEGKYCACGVLGALGYELSGLVERHGLGPFEIASRLFEIGNKSFNEIADVLEETYLEEKVVNAETQAV